MILRVKRRLCYAFTSRRFHFTNTKAKPEKENFVHENIQIEMTKINFKSCETQSRPICLNVLLFCILLRRALLSFESRGFFDSSCTRKQLMEVSSSQVQGLQNTHLWKHCLSSSPLKTFVKSPLQSSPCNQTYSICVPHIAFHGLLEGKQQQEKTNK